MAAALRLALLVAPLVHCLSTTQAPRAALTRRAAMAGALSPLAVVQTAAAASGFDDAAAQLYDPRPPLPTPLAVDGKKNRELAVALVFPLLVYKAAATAMGNKLQWYLDVAIALSVGALVVYLM